MKPLAVIASENLASCCIVRPLLRDLADEIELVLLVPNVSTDSSRARRRAWRLARSASPSFVLFKLLEIHAHHVLARRHGATIQQEAARAGVAVRHYPSVRDWRFLADLRSAAPRYLLSAGPAILTGDVLAVPREGTLNCHGARLPEYRGAANYVWMLLNDETTAYSSVQQMELALDEGPLLAERPVPIDTRWSAYRLNYHVASAGGELYADVVRRALAGGLPQPLERGGVDACNRGFPKRPDIRRLRRSGRRLVTLRDVFQCV